MGECAEDNVQPIFTRLGSPREARSQSPEVKRPPTAEEELQSGLSRQPPETPEIQEAAERVWEKMKHYDYMGSVFSTMRDMIHEDPWSDRERMLKDLKYVPGHDPEVAREMSKTMYRQAERSPVRNSDYVCCLPLQPGANANPTKVSRACLLYTSDAADE